MSGAYAARERRFTGAAEGFSALRRRLDAFGLPFGPHHLRLGLVKITPDSFFSLLTPSKTTDTTVREDRLKAAQDARLREARAAAETLKARSSEASEERKAAARQKIEQLKARLQMLRSMAGIDPKGTARLAAQIARELGAAVKAYAAAGGSPSGVSPTAPAAPAIGNAAVGQDAQPAATQAAPASGDQAATGDAEAADEGQATEGKSTNPYQQAIDEQNARVADMTRRSNAQKADADLMAEVRKMAAELKALVRQATERAKAGEDDALSPQEAAELEKSVASMDQDIGEATADLGGGLLSLLV